MKCIFTHLMNCKKPRDIWGLCEHCSVPPSFGYFWALKGAKMVAEQRFILEHARASRLFLVEQQLAQLQEDICAIRSIPSRDEYLRSGGILNENPTDL